MKPPVDIAQTPWELERLLEVVEAQRPERILEVGIWEGGTLWEWLRIADTVVAIDDAMRPPGPNLWRQWADDAGCALSLIHGRTDWPHVVAEAEERGPYDMVFIDADHRYESVLSDWEAFSPLVESGGMVVFHDILPRADYGVDRLWQDIKGRRYARSVEIVEAGNAATNGIGVVWL